MKKLLSKVICGVLTVGILVGGIAPLKVNAAAVLDSSTNTFILPSTDESCSDIITVVEEDISGFTTAAFYDGLVDNVWLNNPYDWLKHATDETDYSNEVVASPLKSNLMSLNDKIGSDVTNDTKLIDALERAEGHTLIYSKQYSLKDNGAVLNDEGAVRGIRCYFDEEDKQFVYLIFDIFALTGVGAEDYYKMYYFESDYFYMYMFTDSEGTKKVNHYNIGSGDTKDPMKYYSDVLSLILSSGISNAMTNNSNLIDKNFTVHINEDTSEVILIPLTHWLCVGNVGCSPMVTKYTVTTIDNTSNVNFEGFVIDANGQYTIIKDTNLKYEKYKMSPSFLIFGSDEEVEYTLNTDPGTTELFVRDIVEGYTLEVGGNVSSQSEIASKLDLNNCQSTTIRKVLEFYKDKMSEVLESMRISNWTKSFEYDSNKYADYRDYYSLMNAIVQNNFVACTTEEGMKNYNGGGSFKTGIKEGNKDIFITHNKNSIMSYKEKSENSDIVILSISDVYTKLNDEQKLLIGSAYNSRLGFLSEGGYVTEYGKNINFMTFFESYDIYKSSQKYSGSGIFIDGTPLVDYLAKTVDEYDSNHTLTDSVLSYTLYSDVLCAYIIHNMLFGTTGDADIYSIYDAGLDEAISHKYSYDLNELFYPDCYPEQMRNLHGSYNYMLQGFDISEPYYGNWADLLNLLYNISYSFEIMMYSNLGESYGMNMTPDEINSAFDNMFDIHKGSLSTEYNFNNSQGDINVLRSIVSLYDTCKILGIEKGDWTSTIDTYLSIYESHEAEFQIIRSNPYVYGNFDKGSTTIEEPLGTFYSIENQTLSDQWLKGFALSATFSPMNTNLYNADWAEFLGDVEWTSEFYYKYGFYRKALYINTDSSAIVNKFITGADSPTKVATLRDLLTYDRDIVLTVDDNFYNADQLATILGMVDYASVKNNNQLQSEDTGAAKEVFINIKELFDIQPEVILKTGANKYYSTEVFNGATPLGEDEETSESSYDAYLLMKKDILSAIDAQEYSIQQPMAIVSAIYKSDRLFNQMLKCTSVDNAIFKSSKAIASTPGTDESDWLALYNYYMLANLSEQMRNDSASTLDLDAPIFCDIFGNIVTESGLVIIPAASNATICGPEWTPMSVGWADYYYNGEMMLFDDCSIEQLNFLTGATWEEQVDGSRKLQSVAGGIIKESPCGGGWFSVDGDVLQIRTSEVHSANSSAVIQWSNLSKNSENIKQIFYNHNYFDVGPNLYNFVTTNLITEVLRGAPIEHIDYKKEGLDGLKSATRFGVVAAYGLEKVADTVLNSSDGNFKVGNSMTTLPNLAFVEGIEYIVLFAFKIMFAAGIVMLAINLYLDAVQEQLGIKSVIRFAGTLILTLLAILVLPQVLNWSYYRANKALLTDDILYVQMLNYTKEFDGAEINVTTIDTPESTTELYLKLDDISLDWWDVLYEVLFESTNATVTELYEEELADNSYFGAPGVEIKSDGVYISITDIFDSTTVTYLPASNTLMNYTYKESDNLVASYVTPYYYFLDQLIQNINVYNSESAVEAYSYGIGQNGHLYTYELSAPYFKSAAFMEDGYDLLNLHHMFGTNSGSAPVLSTVNESDIELMKFSLWWPSDMATEDMYVKIDNFYNYARDYVANNAELIGKVPDEVFIKTMAMRLAVKWNDMFNIPMGDSIEIMNVDTRDLMRLIAGDKVDVYRYSSYGLARFIYEEGGIMGCIAAALFLGIIWVSNIFKIVVMLVIIGLLIINVFFRRTIYKGEGNLCIEGYIITCGLLAACNLLYAFMLKLCLTVTQYGMGTTSSFIFALAVQVLYLAALLGVLMVVVKDWQHSGLAEWQNVGATVTHNTRELWQKATAGFRRGGFGNNRGHASSGMGEVTVASMLDRDAENEDQFVRENH